jgi:hypothetical protein
MEEARKSVAVWVLVALLIIILVVVLYFAFFRPKPEAIVEEEKFIPTILPTYTCNASTKNDIVYLTIRKTEEGNIVDTLQIALCIEGEYFTWRYAEEVVVDEQKNLGIRPPYSIGFFGENYLLKVRHKEGEKEIFNKSVYLEPRKYKSYDIATIQNETFAGEAVEKVGIILTSAREYSREYEGMEPKAGYKFLVLEIRCKNIGNFRTNISFEEPYVALRTNKDNYYEAKILPLFEGELLPTEEKISQSAFEIPRDQRGVEVYLACKVLDEWQEVIIDVPRTSFSFFGLT